MNSKRKGKSQSQNKAPNLKTETEQQKRARNRKRKEGYIQDRKKRFRKEIARYMERNEIGSIKAFSIGLGFSGRYINDLIGKNDRGIPEWVLTHIYMVDSVESRKNPNHYCFNYNYITTGHISTNENRDLKRKHKKEIEAYEADLAFVKRQLLILQGKYEEAQRKGQANA